MTQPFLPSYINIRSVTAVIARRHTDATKNNTLFRRHTDYVMMLHKTQQSTLALVQNALRALNDVYLFLPLMLKLNVLSIAKL